MKSETVVSEFTFAMCQNNMGRRKAHRGLAFSGPSMRLASPLMSEVTGQLHSESAQPAAW